MRVAEVPRSKLPPFTMKFVEAAEKLGVKARPMPKSVDFNKCIGCGKCAYGCTKGCEAHNSRPH
ncbi:MAG: hypothetical protein QW701_06140 [Candidatus Nezhaarchaeales archaeon]